MSGLVAPASRNAPCPCGSGLRYKECHGAIGTAATADPLAEARAALASGDTRAARAAAEGRLRSSNEDPYALEILARCAGNEGDSIGALRLWLHAARAQAAASAPAAFAYMVWSELSHAFGEAMRGLDVEALEARLRAYRDWLRSRGAQRTDANAAIVLVVPPHAGAAAVETTLASIVAQSRPPVQLVVAPLAGARGMPALRARCGLLPFNVTWVDERGAKAEALDAAVAAVDARWIVVVEPPHAFAATHVETMTNALATRGARMGFSDATIVPMGNASPERIAAARSALDASHTALAKADSLGQSLIDAAFVAIGDGALMFDRSLWRDAGGFRPVAGHELWDFALRAALHDEPVHVDAATYRHAVHAAEPQRSPAEREAAQLAMFRAFYEQAADPAFTAPNPFAPTLAAWGVAFLRRLFRTGHVLMVAQDRLEQLADMIAERAREASLPALTPGINLVGFAYGEFGLAENLRAMARSCNAAGVPFVVNDLEHRLAARQTDRTLAPHVASDIRHSLSVMCANPDVIDVARPWLARTRRAGGRGVGYWYWELETLPVSWHRAIDDVDELWCATDFIAGALHRATTKPVVKVPPAVEVSLAKAWHRRDFDLPDATFLFLFTFDYHSFVARKNPAAAIAAFRSAFPAGRPDVGLVVKSVNGVHRPDRVADIEAQIGGDPRIHHIDRFLDRDGSYGLISVADCYVSLHRSEGLGLGLAEAMLLGKPAIATGYSGNLEFMNEANSLLVDHRMVPVRPGEYLFDDPAFFWAEPDIEDAARKMRRVVDDTALRARLAVAGPAGVRAVFSRERSAAVLRDRLDALGMLHDRPHPGPLSR